MFSVLFTKLKNYEEKRVKHFGPDQAVSRDKLNSLTELISKGRLTLSLRIHIN